MFYKFLLIIIYFDISIKSSIFAVEIIQNYAEIYYIPQADG